MPWSSFWVILLESGYENATWTFLKHKMFFGWTGQFYIKNITFAHFFSFCRLLARKYETKSSPNQLSLLLVLYSQSQLFILLKQRGFYYVPISKSLIFSVPFAFLLKSFRPALNFPPVYFSNFRVSVLWGISWLFANSTTLKIYYQPIYTLALFRNTLVFQNP